MRSTLLFTICLILPFLLAAQDQSDNLIPWNSQKLVWPDFKGEPDASSEYKALTQWRLSYDFQVAISNGAASIARSNVKTFFSRNDSWTKSSTGSTQLLEHEQGHFDLAEVYARKFRKDLVDYTFKTDKYQKELEGLFNKILAACDKAQTKYDKETKHGIVEAEQASWNEKIKADLEKLSEFALSD